MVIPRVARQKGITVPLYAVFVVVFASIGFTLLCSQRASAAPPLISGIPIIGQPVASIVDVVADDVIKPVVSAVANVVSPQPAASPTHSAITPSSAANIVSSQTATQPTQSTERTNQSISSEPVIKPNPSVASYTPLLLSGYLPITSDMNMRFSTSKDASVFLAAGVIALLMLLAFVRLITMMIHTMDRLAPTNEATFVRRDLAQASALTLGLFVVGPALLFIILH